MPSASADPRFCCTGCRAVHGWLHSAGLDRFYALGGGSGQPVGNVPEPARRDWLDDALAAGQVSPTQVRLPLDIQGIHCAACVWVLHELWRRRVGAVHIEVNPAVGSVVLVFDPTRLDVGAYLDDVERLGYRLAPAGKPVAHGERGLLLRMGVCVALALNSMMFALAGYFGMAEADGPAYSLFHWLSFALSSLAVVVGGPVFFRAALVGLRHRVLHLDLPISLGLLLAFGGSTYQFLTGGGPSYFDTVTVFVALMLIGRFLQQRAVRRNRDYLLANTGAEHLRAKRIAAERLESVPVARVRRGDLLLLAPGDLVPTRCALADQGGRFSLDWINGESRPAEFGAGALVPAGAFLRSPHAVRAIAVEDAVDSELLKLLATPAGDRDDRARSPFWVWLNRGYVWLVLALAATACAVWSVLDASRALEVTVAVLVVTCPCALGLATPLAFDLALARLRRLGVYVRTTSLLDKARRVRTVIFDKTGTLTWGDLVAAPLRPIPPTHRDVLLTMASSSNHPVSRAIVAAVTDPGFDFLGDLAVEEQPGCGLVAHWQGHEYRLGAQSYAFAERSGPRDGRLCVFTCDGHVEACFAIREHLRPGFRSEIAWLQRAGQRVVILSGDSQGKVRSAAERLGVAPEDAVGELAPAQKAALVRELDHHDTMMVGDGLNDAPAFEAAWCAGSAGLDRPALPSRADFFFLGEGSAAVRLVLQGARRLHGVVLTNLWLAAAYNAIALTLCFGGAMTPLLCAVLMPASSLLLVWHTAVRLRPRAAATALGYAEATHEPSGAPGR
ncbi:MAG: HAD-IC family P-type ATPase [Planctomycetes bacterium]|nr:HAD-IC family P-type ATPase [Planctomycetota bacterium]MCB9870090.1 HAD-IC family P-type ATPase [Planctomycetota bacterium]